MEPITKKTFRELTKTEQVVLVLKSGKELLTRDDDEHVYRLYLLSKMFVELEYSSNKSTIVKINTPTKDNLIQNYPLDKDEINQYLHA